MAMNERAGGGGRRAGAVVKAVCLVLLAWDRIARFGALRGRAGIGERRAGALAKVILFLLLVARSSPLAAQAPPPAPEPQPQAVSAIVPVVGLTLGANDIVWRTSLELDNSGSTQATVAVSLPAAPDQPMILLTMPPASVQRFDDVIGEAFGLERAVSPLLVQTAGRRSVTIRATAYGVRGAEVFKPEPITVSYGETYYPIRYLQGLSFSDAFRTNIGLANLSDEPATFALALQRLPGRNLAVTRITVPPNTLWHQSVQMFFPLIDSSEESFSVLVETFTRHTYVYGSVIDNATNEAHFIDAVVAAPTNAQ